MRLIALLLALLTLAPAMAHAAAQDDDRSTTKAIVPVEKKQDAPAKTEKAAPVSEDTGEEQGVAMPAPEVERMKTEDEESKPKVNWVDVESTGTISSGKQGALEKTIWAKQKRSEIESLTARLPDAPALRSVQSLQRRLLLSQTDFGKIENDIGPLRGQDFLIQRIHKLTDMGLYDDAWELYTQKAEDPYDVSIAQQGMILMVMRSDLATACLEEKVFSTRYPKDEFFATLDKACAQTLGATAKPTFDNSKILQSVYNEAAYKVPATSFDALVKMSDLERALVLANGKISYAGLTPDALAKAPSSLVSLYLLDRTIPEDAAAMVRAEARNRGIAPYMGSVIRDETFKKIKDMKNPEERWVMIESALSEAGRRNADFKPLQEYISEAEPKNLSTEVVIKVLNILLSNGQALTPFWVDAAQKIAPQKPLIYIYLQAFQSLTPTKIPSLDKDQVAKALRGLKPADSDQIIAIIDSLDKEAGYGTNLLNAYDKHLGLTLENNYVMPSVGLNILLETAPEQKQTGITVLAVLNSLAAKPDNMYSGSVRKALYSMLNVGLLEDAKTIGSEIVASVLNKY